MSKQVFKNPVDVRLRVEKELKEYIQANHENITEYINTVLSLAVKYDIENSAEWVICATRNPIPYVFTDYKFHKENQQDPRYIDPTNHLPTIKLFGEDVTLFELGEAFQAIREKREREER